jgi:hypothetical protein
MVVLSYLYPPRRGGDKKNGKNGGFDPLGFCRSDLT